MSREDKSMGVLLKQVLSIGVDTEKLVRLAYQMGRADALEDVRDKLKDKTK